MPRNSSRIFARNAARDGAHLTSRAGDMPAATRATTSGWRDPRLWVGIVLVTGSVVAGARLFATADDMTSVWAASSDLVAGQRVTSTDLVATRVRFDEAADGGRYLDVADELPADLVLTRPIEAGELVPQAALGADDGEEQVRVSISVASEDVPTGVERGSHIDVWVLADGSRRVGGAEPILEDIVVLDAPIASGTFATGSTRQLVLQVPSADQEALASLLAASASDRIRVVGRD